MRVCSEMEPPLEPEKPLAGLQPATSFAPAPAPSDPADGDVLDDGQEEVFSHSAVERGLVEDPKALGPEDLARAPKSPGSIAPG